MAVRDGYCPTVITFLVVDSIAVGLRFWARGSKKAVGYDDVTMAVFLVSSSPAFLMLKRTQDLMCRQVGFTIFCVMEHQSIDYGIGATTSEEDFDLIKAAMLRLLVSRPRSVSPVTCANVFTCNSSPLPRSYTSLPQVSRSLV